MKKTFLFICLMLVFGSVFAYEVNNHANIKIQNNLPFPITAQLLSYDLFAVGSNPGYPNESANCVLIDNYPSADAFNNGNPISVNSNSTKNLGALYDINNQWFFHRPDNTSCFRNTNFTTPNSQKPAIYNVLLTIHDGSSQPKTFTVSYNSVYRYPGLATHHILCEPSDNSDPSPWPLSVTAPHDNYVVTVPTDYTQIQNCQNNPFDVVFTVDYVNPPTNTIKVTNVMNRTGKALTTKLLGPAANFNPNPPPAITSDPVIAGFTYQIPVVRPEQVVFIQYGYQEGDVDEKCRFLYQGCPGPSCNIGGANESTNKFLYCQGSAYSCENGICTLHFVISRQPSITFNFQNNSGQMLAAQYDPVNGRYLPVDPPPANGGNYTFSTWPTNNATAHVTYTVGSDSCTYTYSYSYNTSTKVWEWTVNAANNRSNSLINCSNDTPVCDGGNCTVNFKINKFVPAIPPKITANFVNRASIKDITAAYGVPPVGGSYTPANPNPPGNFIYDFPIATLGGDNLITYTVANGDSCQYGYTYDPTLGCAISVANKAENKATYCDAKASSATDKCAFDLTIYDLPKIDAHFLNNTGEALNVDKFTGVGTYNPNPPVAGDFIYTMAAEDVTNAASITYKTAMGADSCTYTYYWDKQAEQCVISVQNNPDNKLIDCVYTATSTNKCAGNFSINRHSNAPYLYTVIIKNNIFADLLPEPNDKLSLATVEDGQVSQPIPLNSSATIIYKLANLKPLTPACQFTVGWQDNKPISIKGTFIGNNNYSQYSLNVNCKAPKLDEIQCDPNTRQCNIIFSVEAPATQ